MEDIRALDTGPLVLASDRATAVGLGVMKVGRPVALTEFEEEIELER